MERKIIYKKYSFQVTAADQPYSKKFDLDKNIKLIRGLLLSSEMPNLLFYRGSQRIEISGDELYPENFESRLLMSGLNVPPDQKYVDLGDGVFSGNGEVKITYQDTSNPLAAFQPYQVHLVLKCEIG